MQVGRRADVKWHLHSEASKWGKKLVFVVQHKNKHEKILK